MSSALRSKPARLMINRLLLSYIGFYNLHVLSVAHQSSRRREKFDYYDAWPSTCPACLASQSHLPEDRYLGPSYLSGSQARYPTIYVVEANLSSGLYNHESNGYLQGRVSWTDVWLPLDRISVQYQRHFKSIFPCYFLGLPLLRLTTVQTRPQVSLREIGHFCFVLARFLFVNTAVVRGSVQWSCGLHA